MPLSFMDDLVVPVTPGNSLQLFEHVEIVASPFVKIATAFGLEVSFAQGKTEAIMQFAGLHTLEARSYLCNLGQSQPGEEDPIPLLPLSGGGHFRIVNAYWHLGAMVAPLAYLSREVHQRVGGC